MKENDLRKLSRQQLLELLLKQSRELDKVRAQLEEAQNALKDRQIRIRESGSIAEAALELSGIFEAAQQAADDYLYNVTGGRYGAGVDDRDEQYSRSRRTDTEYVEYDDYDGESELEYYDD